MQLIQDIVFNLLKILYFFLLANEYYRVLKHAASIVNTIDTQCRSDMSHL